MKTAGLFLSLLLLSTPAFAITPIYGHKVSRNLLPDHGKTFTNSRSDERTAERTLEKGPNSEASAEASTAPAWDPDSQGFHKDANLDSQEIRRGSEPIKKPWPDGTGLGLAED